MAIFRVMTDELAESTLLLEPGPTKALSGQHVAQFRRRSERGASKLPPMSVLLRAPFQHNASRLAPLDLERQTA
jgi:hypothetical protein